MEANANRSEHLRSREKSLKDSYIRVFYWSQVLSYEV